MCFRPTVRSTEDILVVVRDQGNISSRLDRSASEMIAHLGDAFVLLSENGVVHRVVHKSIDIKPEYAYALCDH